jgi:branched-chain amino acid transport system ATP-binding protein
MPAPAVDYFSFPDITLAEEQSESLLSIRSMDVSYGQVQVLFGVNLELEEGEIIALLGTNGAGKSTVLRGVSGLSQPDRGSISFDGVDITSVPAHRIAEMGIAQVPGGKGVFPSLSVAENLALGGWLRRSDSAHMAEATERVLSLFPPLAEKLDAPAASLSGGQQQMLTLGMALMAKPRILLIDELSLGLAPVIVEELLRVVRQLNADGVTIVIVEQSVNVALTIADTAYFMEKGEIRFHGPTAELLDRDDILRSVFLEGSGARKAGARKDGPVPRVSVKEKEKQAVLERAPVRLKVDGLTKSFAGIKAVSDVGFELYEGEILGMIGPNGAGKTTVFELISGFQVPDAGQVWLDGRDISSLSPDRRAHLGLSRSFQDSRLFGALTVEDVIKMSLDQTLEVHDPVAAALGLPDVAEAEQRLTERTDEMVELMGLQTFRDKFVSELSTGTRRIVDLGCQMTLEPRVILFDEPSSGIAQRETEALGPLLERIRDETGASLLVIEHDIPLLTSISDRIIALDLGAKVIEGSAATVLNDERVVASYLGSAREVIERSGTIQTAAGEREPDLSGVS